MQRTPIPLRPLRDPIRRVRARRGVSSVLAMMYLVIFGSLAAAMAVVAQGNLRTANSNLQVNRAMSAAETGLAFATRRLAAESKRFVTEKGVIDGPFAHDLWMGEVNEGVDGPIIVLPPDGYVVGSPPDGIGEAVRDAHLADSVDMTVIVDAGDGDLPDFNADTGVVLCRPIVMSAEPGSPHFRLRYEIDDVDPVVHVTSIGTDGTISRTLRLDYRIDKKIEYAVISPNRIMIGKNVRVEGPLGTRYGLEPGELDSANGDPLVMRGDFNYLDDDLDADLADLAAVIVTNDVDGDGRLRPNHVIEGDGLGDYDALVDYNGDEYVDEFDLFLAHYDTNDDFMVVYDAALAIAAGYPSPTVEFDGVDDQLARLIDEWKPDRNEDGVVDAVDTTLGYRNGIIESLDRYAKVHGRLVFAVSRETWETANGGSYQQVVTGAIRPSRDDAAVRFEATEEELREITTDMFGDSQTWFETESLTGDAFMDQVNANLAEGGDASFTAPASYEAVPFGAPGAYDYYQRPVFANMTFTNVRVPKGMNPLFESCTFVGVTYVETNTDCDHENWNYAGALELVDGDYVLKFPYIYAEDAGGTIPDTKVESNSVRFQDCTFLGSVAGDKPEEYAHWRNKIQFTGNTRFYLDPDDDEVAEQDDGATLVALLNGLSAADRQELAKSSILMPGWSVDVGNFANEQAADPEDTPTVRLRGTIVAGILDVRGTADVFGTLLMTFRPVANAGPLFYGGLPDAFNTTIGYFGPADGDGEGSDPDDAGFEGFGEITLRYDPDARLPDGIPWPISCAPDVSTYAEGGG